MKTRTFILTVSLTALALFTLAFAQSTPPPRAKAAPVFDQPIPNIPGKSLIAAEVTYAPGAKSPSHHHAKSAFIFAYVVSGAVRSQVDDQPVKIYKAGETWFENPGAHHKVSENASATEPAKLLAVFVVDTNDKPLTTVDAEHK
jgi:quercetin dioxygenase-like cupin family protein